MPADEFVWEPGDQAKLELLCPKFAGLVTQLGEMMNLAGQPVRIIDAVRSWKRQEALWEQGRMVGGPIVTDARPGASWHEFGLACDLGICSLLSQPGWDPGNPLWEKMGNMGKTLGVFWGGDFQHNPDRPHFQLTGCFPISPDDEVRQIFLDQGMSAVWQAAGLV